MPKQQLDSLDLSILKMLTENARMPYLEISRECGVSGAAVHQRIQRLTANGVIIRSQCVVNPVALGYETCAFIGLILRDPSSHTRMVECLRDFPEIIECYYTSGKYDILVKLLARNNMHLLQILQDLQNLGMARTETIVSFKTVFERQSPIALLLEKTE